MGVVFNASDLALLRGPNFCILATQPTAGPPQLSAIWIGLEGDSIVICTTKSTAKTKNMLRDPQVSLCLLNADNPYETLTIGGRVRAVTDHDGPKVIDELALKYTGQPYKGHEIRRDWIIFLIEPFSVMHYSSTLYPGDAD